MSEHERADEQLVTITLRIVIDDRAPRPRVMLGPPTAPGENCIHPPLADFYHDAKFHAWVGEVNRSYLQRQYAARHINRA